VHVLAPEWEGKPYKRKVVEASFDQLPNGAVLKEKDIQEKIDQVYPQIPILDISIHTEPLPKLRNNSKAILIEALDIEGAVCILDTDRFLYKNATSEDRIGLEIPVNLRALKSFGEKLEQMKLGSRPFIVPRNPDYDRLGLRLDSQL
jgi:CRISPR-associated endonuclease/helicase Cas3